MGLCAGGAAATGADTLRRLEAGEPVRIGYAGEPPYAFRGPRGTDEGFMNALAIRILRRLGARKVVGVVTLWDTLLKDLNDNRIDIVTAGMFILPERCRRAAFSAPVGRFTEAFMVRRGNPLALRSYADVKEREAARLVTVSGYASVGFARRAGVPAERIIQVNEPEEMVRALLLGRAQAAAATKLALRYLLREGRGRLVVAQLESQTVPVEHSGFAFRASDTALKAAFDREIAKLLGTVEFFELVRDYGYRRENLPDKDVTVASLCGAR